ncbi:MAG: DUF2207 domain-containing protein [Alphaproteobacteria bacterium]|nr:DUF2207 domain-containing protein [Alphaproteobacteria bacterium]
MRPLPARALIGIALAWLALTLAAPLHAQDFGGGPQTEEITDYHSDIVVTQDGTLGVTETIHIVALGEQIRHGIYRDFPTTYKDKLGSKVRVRFDVQRVTLDGEEAPYTLEGLSNGVRIKIGSADTEVSPGPHVYSIAYTTNRQIGFFDGYDELYWNVTGNGWVFPILHASATIRLPDGAHIKHSDVYTGAAGDTLHNAEANQFTGSAIRFETTAPLSSYEGLTVAVAFDKGAITPPTATEEASTFARDNASIAAALIGVLMVAAFYIYIWNRVGRDPARGTIIALFAPPRGFSPAATRFVNRMGYDRKAFSAALIDMAVKGYMTIAEEDRTYTLARTGKSDTECGLSGGERGIANALFDGPADSIELKQTNHSDIARAISALKDSLRNEYETKYFATNSGWFIAGLAILILTGIASALLADDPATAGGMMAWISGWSVGCAFLVHRAATAWGDVIDGPGSRVSNLIVAVFMSAFAVPFVGGLIFVMAMMTSIISPLVLLALAAGGIVAYVFYHLLKAPTLLGAKIMDEIEGFKLFLDTAERERLEYLHPPDVTPEVFEKFLPYAIALDCENAWSKKFEAQAARAAAESGRQTSYVPIWYSGHSFDRLGAAGFASAIGSSVASAAASASTAPGSSSGSFGGGSSGGGGGGGGGGGW